MKKFIALLTICCTLCLLSGCQSSPDALQLDLFQGYGSGMRLLHLNASSSKNRQRILDFRQALEDPQPLDKDISMFAYYPDYQLELRDRTAGSDVTTVIVDVNGDWVDFICPTSHEPEQIYRSRMSAETFKELVHQ